MESLWRACVAGVIFAAVRLDVHLKFALCKYVYDECMCMYVCIWHCMYVEVRGQQLSVLAFHLVWDRSCLQG